MEPIVAIARRRLIFFLTGWDNLRLIIRFAFSAPHKTARVIGSKKLELALKKRAIGG